MASKSDPAPPGGRRRKGPKTASERIGAELERWFLVEPLLFGVWSTHRLVANPRCPTIRTLAGRIEYDTAFIDGLDDGELRAVMLLEGLRIALRHPYHRRQPDPSLAYRASNLALQEVLRLPFLPTAREVFRTADHDGQWFEYYYRLLAQTAPGSKRGPGSPDEEGGGSGSGFGERTGATGAKRGQGAARGASGGSKVGGDGPASGGRFGLALHGDAEKVGLSNAAGWDGDDDVAEAIEKEIRIAESSQSWGTVAGRAKIQLLAGLSPRLRYQDVLRQFRASLPSSDVRLTRSRPSRRYGFEQLGRRYEPKARLLFALDVSGSMSDEDIAAGFGIVHRFFAHRVPQIDVIAFDTEVQGPVLSLRRGRRAYTVLGRGGTSFQPVMDHIDAHPVYDGLLIYTDGFAPTPTPPKCRRTRMVWLFTQESTWRTMGVRLDRAGGRLGKACFIRPDRS